MPGYNPSAFTPDFFDPNSPLTLLTSTSQNCYRIITASLLSTLPTTVTHPHLPAFPPGTDHTLTPFHLDDPNYHPLPRHLSSTDFIEPLPVINYKLLHPLINICNQFLTVEARERVNEVARIRELYYKVHERLMGLRRRLEAIVAWAKILRRRLEVGGEGKGKGNEGEELETRVAISRNELEMKYLIGKLEDCARRRVEITARFGRTKKAFLEKDMPKLVLLGRWIMRRHGFEDASLFSEQGVGIPATSTDHSMEDANVVRDGDTGPHGIVFYDDKGRPVPYVRHSYKSTGGNEATKGRTSSHTEPTIQHQSITSTTQNQPLDFTTENTNEGGTAVEDTLSSSVPFGPTRHSATNQKPSMENQYMSPNPSKQLINFSAVSNEVTAVTTSSDDPSTTHMSDDNPFTTRHLVLFNQDGNPITEHHRPIAATDTYDEAEDDGIIPHHSPTINTPFPTQTTSIPTTATSTTLYAPATPHNSTTLNEEHANYHSFESQEPTFDQVESFLDAIMGVDLDNPVQDTDDPPTTAVVNTNYHPITNVSTHEASPPSRSPIHPILPHEVKSFVDVVMSMDVDDATDNPPPTAVANTEDNTNTKNDDNETYENESFLDAVMSVDLDGMIEDACNGFSKQEKGSRTIRRLRFD